MPIKPENKARYPKNWKQIRAFILERAENRCEFCGVENYSIRTGSKGKPIKVILTIAHLDHTPENCDPGNLRALCQQCHNIYDKEHRSETRRKTAELVKIYPANQHDCFDCSHGKLHYSDEGTCYLECLLGHTNTPKLAKNCADHPFA